VLVNRTGDGAIARQYLLRGWGAFGIFGARYFWHTSFNTRGGPLGHGRGGTGSSPHSGLDQQKAPPEETGLEGWMSCEESFSGLNLNWLMAFVGPASF